MGWAEMTLMKVVFITLGLILLFIMAHQLTMYVRPGIFPPKRVVKERIVVAGGAGVCFLCIGILFAILAK
ncbi:hypothetical protein MUB24_05690 [Lederbergia sp. NSJ-179]|uniref:hypothetical protein n=1 Tax=Lederbergia sp. NSJ-179 TaxID=2931402 RepID=UPI001FD0051B|nr:hypothetical protein [Lederbergia sp. NSJ-179]MCJ7840418.1 hypothetical protein [Lederbergia sp. NSJ-179]